MNPACSPAAGGAYDCQVPLPAMTVGAHSLTVTATRTIGGSSMDSAPSAPLSVTLFVVVSPSNLRLIRS